MEPHGDELAWIESAQRGDQQAFAQLVEAYKLPVYNLAYRMLGNAPEAEDAAQEAFLRAYLKLASFDRARRFSSWLFSITSNYCIDVLRRRRAPLAPLEEAEYTVASEEPGPEQRAVAGEQRDEIARAINALTPTYRLPAVLRYYHDLSYDEIGEATGLTEAAIKSRLHRARHMIKAFLERQGAVA